MSEQTYPFKTLGQRLKALRQKLQETVDDVSGAIEIDSNLLNRYEQGMERPAEDILMLLINHYGMQEGEAALLWQLAGYELPNDQELPEDTLDRSMVLVMAVDPRVIYSDGMQASSNNNGIVLNFTQALDSKKQLVAARIGMSREQAQNVLEMLQKALHPEPRLLSPPAKNSKNDTSQA